MSYLNQSPVFALTGLFGVQCVFFSGCESTAPSNPQRPPATVSVARPVTKQIVEWDAYTGRLEAVEFVEVRARISGYLQSIHFQEGQIVDEGDLLFVIDPRPFEAELSRAQALLSQARSQLKQANAQLEDANAKQKQTNAQLVLAETRVKRTRALKAQSATSQEDLDQREAEFLQAAADTEVSKATIASAEAAVTTADAGIEVAEAGVEAAELELDYTRIHAPLSGRISHEYVTRGNLVSGGTANSTLLTTITSVEPIYCTFDANEQQVLKYIRLADLGKRASSRDAKNPVYLGLVDETAFPRQGHMDFVDNRLDNSTASLRARCVFSNADGVLLPGMFARIRIPGSSPYRAVLIPDSAIGTDQSSQFVYVVIDGKIERRRVTSGPTVDGLRVIREGLDGDESLVVQGLLQARPGMQVEVVEGEIESIEDGLPDDYEPLAPEQWIEPHSARTAEAATSSVPHGSEGDAK